MIPRSLYALEDKIPKRTNAPHRARDDFFICRTKVRRSLRRLRLLRMTEEGNLLRSSGQSRRMTENKRPEDDNIKSRRMTGEVSGDDLLGEWRRG